MFPSAFTRGKAGGSGRRVLVARMMWSKLWSRAAATSGRQRASRRLDTLWFTAQTDSHDKQTSHRASRGFGHFKVSMCLRPHLNVRKLLQFKKETWLISRLFRYLCILIFFRKVTTNFGRIKPCHLVCCLFNTSQGKTESSKNHHTLLTWVRGLKHKQAGSWNECSPFFKTNKILACFFGHFTPLFTLFRPQKSSLVFNYPRWPPSDFSGFFPRPPSLVMFIVQCASQDRIMAKPIKPVGKRYPKESQRWCK